MLIRLLVLVMCGGWLGVGLPGCHEEQRVDPFEGALAQGALDTAWRVCAERAERGRCLARLGCQIGASPCGFGAPGASPGLLRGLEALQQGWVDAARQELLSAGQPRHPGDALLAAHLEARLAEETGTPPLDRLWAAIQATEMHIYRGWPALAGVRSVHRAAYETALSWLARAGKAEQVCALVGMLSRAAHERAPGAARQRADRLARRSPEVRPRDPVEAPPAGVAILEVYLPEERPGGLIWRAGERVRVQTLPLMAGGLATLSQRDDPPARARPEVRQEASLLLKRLLAPVMHTELSQAAEVEQMVMAIYGLDHLEASALDLNALRPEAHRGDGQAVFERVEPEGAKGAVQASWMCGRPQAAQLVTWRRIAKPHRAQR